jgi:hypothetical protein
MMLPAPPPGDDVDLVLFQERRYPAGELPDDAVLADLDARPVDLHVAGRQPELPGVQQVLVSRSVLEERLGGDASPVETSPALEGVLLDEGGPEPELAGADRGHVAPRTAADDHDVVAGIRHAGARV